MRITHLFTDPTTRAGIIAAIEDAQRRMSKLTHQQRRIVDLMIDGNLNKVIAHQLGISQRTVENHRMEIMLRLGATTMADVTRIVLLAG